MVCIGSPNYINLSPYQISSPVRKMPMAFTSHWFLIQVISSIIDISTFGNSKKIYFSSDNMVTNGWFKMYLNQEQFQFLENSTYFKLYSIEKKNKFLMRKSIENNGYYVHASNDWAPPSGAQVVSRISDTIFYVKNLIIDQNVLNDPRILEINPAGTKKAFNRYNSGFLQNGNQFSTYNNGIFAPIRPLHNIGLNGSGQVVNVMDSGVDVFSAFFYDPDPANNLDSITGKTNKNHRKVIRIEPYVDNTDTINGHGTHVAGTACGCAICTDCGIAQYNGIAPDAKLYFSDIGNSTSGEITGDVDVNEQAKLFAELDVHITSNSWGYNYNYPEVEYNYNKVAYDNPDVLYVFAAGNSQQYNTINSPGNTKNVFTIGSSDPIAASTQEFSTVSVQIQNETYLIDTVDYMTKIIYESSKAVHMKYYVNHSVVEFRDPYLELNCTNYTDTNCTLNPETNETTCTNITVTNCSDPVPDPDFDAAAYYNNTIVVTNKEVLDDDEKICTRIKSASDFGAVAGIYVPQSAIFKCPVEPTVPMLRIVEAMAPTQIPSILQMGKVSLLPIKGEGDPPLPLPAAQYQSSKGPADSGLSKPDIITPGVNVFSAKSHGPTIEDVVVNTTFSESVIRKSGTSMATPAASGLAIIVSQYLRDGFYPGLKKGSGDSILPSSCLLRGILINTALKPKMKESESKSGPRNDVGFGIPCLESALGFGDTSLRFADHEIMPSNSHRVYTINLDSNSADLSVTLVYLDPALSTDNEAILFADLDMYIKSPSGDVYMGNNVSEGETLSLIERVVINKEDIPADGGKFEIHIISSKYPIENQQVTYSITVNGPFEMTNSEKNPLILEAKVPSDDDCPNNCGGNGKCVNGRCVCQESFTGPYCNINIETLHDASSHEETYQHKEIRYFKLPLNENPSVKVTNISFDIVKSDNLGPVYFCTSFNEYPGKYTDAGWECHLACPPPPDAEDPEDYPYFANYTIQVPSDADPSSFYIAFYTGYYLPETIGMNNIILSVQPRDDATSTALPPPPSSSSSSSDTTTSNPPTAQPPSSSSSSSSSDTTTSNPPTAQPPSSSSSTTESSSQITIDYTPASSSSDSSGSDSSNNKKNKFPVLAIVLISFVCLFVVASITILILAVLQRFKKDNNKTSSIDMNLLGNKENTAF